VETLLGALEAHVRTKTANFQPKNANFASSDRWTEVHGQERRYDALARRSLDQIDSTV
jgi:folate-dependent tRNA-U54 methylase TrmFO/GidA